MDSYVWASSSYTAIRGCGSRGWSSRGLCFMLWLFERQRLSTDLRCRLEVRRFLWRKGLTSRRRGTGGQLGGMMRGGRRRREEKEGGEGGRKKGGERESKEKEQKEDQGKRDQEERRRKRNKEGGEKWSKR